MPGDDESKPGKAGDDRQINVDDTAELKKWSAVLGIPPTEVRAAVLTVGPSVEKVKELLKALKRR